MQEIKVYLTPEELVIQYPEGMPEEEALERVYAHLQEKSPSACANMQKGDDVNTARIQDDSKAKQAESQELFRQLDPEEQKEAVRFMRELIGDKA